MTNIVMLVKDRYRLTEQALVSLYNHTDQDAFNLTIVDDGSMDFRLVALLAYYSYRSNCTVLSLSHSRGVLSQNKNIGVEASRQLFGEGDWLYISDNDVYFTPFWLDRLTAMATMTAGHGYRLWGGQVHPFHAVPATQVWSHNEIYGLMYRVKVLDGPSWLMGWGTWDNVGPLPRTTAAGVCQSEEYPFCTRLENDWEAKIGVIVPHVVYHTGLTQTDGKQAPGYAERLAQRVRGVLYE